MARFALTASCALALLALVACDASEPQASAPTANAPASGAATPTLQMPAQMQAKEVAPSKPGKEVAPAKPASKPAAKKAKASVPIGTGFDFYVLALSWSPSYCEIEGEEANGQQCRSGRPYAFIVHGLWPQFEQGYPQDCDAKPPYVDDAIVRSLRDIMPSGGLIGYQWRKHGGCAGLSQDDYFTVLRAARERTVVPSAYRAPSEDAKVDPDQVERAFLDANPGLTASAIAVTCEERYLSEVRLCLTKDLAFRPCPEVDRRACSLSSAEMPAVVGN